MILEPGDRVSHYRIVGKIGEGGMGVIFKAEDLTLQRPVALKVLTRSSASGGANRARLLREARAAAALNHPSICTIYEVHESEELSFIAMEMVEGETLQTLLGRAGPLPLARLLDIAVEVADGLAEAHARRFVHRDLKPQNIMITPQGRAKLLDFGLAIPVCEAGADPAAVARPDPAREGSTTGTHSTSGSGGGLHGTLPYMSPEQVLGRELDPRSDLFSFGTVLYEMATGRRPFEAVGATTTLMRILESEPEPPTRINPSLPAAFERLVQRCHRKTPTERFGDARDLARALVDLRGALAARGGEADPGASAAAGAPAVSPATIAVFPFAVRGSDRLAYLGEGLVDLLGTKLDGAGDLKSVDANVVLGSLAREVRGPITPGQAGELAARLGAGLYVLGHVFEAGGQIQISAALYASQSDASKGGASQGGLSQGGGAVLARGSVQGDAGGIFEMVDDLTTQILASRGGGPESRFTRIAALATGSFTALKAYLEGEAEMRAMRREPAIEAYRRSVAADPAFALAWYRLSVAALWSGQADLALEAARQALRHKERLSERDGRLLEAFDAVLRADNDEAERLYRSLLGAHPDDVEAWYQLGEVQFHAGPLRGRPMTASAPAWERVVALDPHHVNGLVHLGSIAASRGDRTGFEGLFRRVLVLSPGSDAALWMRAVRAVATGDRSLQDAVEAELPAARDVAAHWAVRAVASYLGDFAAGLRLSRALVEPLRAPETRALGHVLRAHLELAMGRWSAARGELAEAAALDRDQAAVFAALLAAAPAVRASDAQLRAARDAAVAWRPGSAPAGSPGGVSAPRRLPRADLYAAQRLYVIGLLSARLDDHAAVEEHAAALERCDPPPDVLPLVLEAAAALRARVAWSLGRREEAVGEILRARRPVRFDLLHPSLFHSQADERFTLAGWLEELGRHEEALPWYASFVRGSVHDLVHAAPSYLREAAIHECLGDRERARERCARFATEWRDCDAELRPLLEEALAGLGRLGATPPGATAGG
ncbi:MAG TPA: protein kinase [Patescibacteria group bacterium]|nr:protein kinase [Patescibacteria group bacterium]